jgi:hypothetical protein
MGRTWKAIPNPERVCTCLLTAWWIPLLLIGCAPSAKQESPTHDEPTEVDASENPFGELLSRDWDYQPLYGTYLHDSNTKGFSGLLEIEPEGNDLFFSLAIQQSSCTGSAEGLISMAIFSENEYAGFFDHANCRMEFLFNLKHHTIRIQEIGLCTLHESGCSFNGTYTKTNNP